jgi:hypothetical protein
MADSRNRFGLLPAIISALLLIAGAWAVEEQLPEFKRDTVLVWSITNQEYSAQFVVRIAQFIPDRFLEWEDKITQGTVFMPSRDILEAKGYINSQMFKAGVDIIGKDSTTLWLSEKIFRELKENKKAKCNLDKIQGTLIYVGDDQLSVEVNRSAMLLPAIKVTDDRGSERWFLDQDKNPLLLKHTIRQFSQTLTSITTTRKNTLRWIKK